MSGPDSRISYAALRRPTPPTYEIPLSMISLPAAMARFEIFEMVLEAPLVGPSGAIGHQPESLDGGRRARGRGCACQRTARPGVARIIRDAAMQP